VTARIAPGDPVVGRRAGARLGSAFATATRTFRSGALAPRNRLLNARRIASTCSSTVQAAGVQAERASASRSGASARVESRPSRSFSSRATCSSIDRSPAATGRAAAAARSATLATRKTLSTACGKTTVRCRALDHQRPDPRASRSNRPTRARTAREPPVARPGAKPPACAALHPARVLKEDAKAFRGRLQGAAGSPRLRPRQSDPSPAGRAGICRGRAGGNHGLAGSRRIFSESRANRDGAIHRPRVDVAEAEFVGDQCGAGVSAGPARVNRDDWVCRTPVRVCTGHGPLRAAAPGARENPDRWWQHRQRVDRHLTLGRTRGDQRRHGNPVIIERLHLSPVQSAAATDQNPSAPPRLTPSAPSSAQLLRNPGPTP